MTMTIPTRGFGASGTIAGVVTRGFKGASSVTTITVAVGSASTTGTVAPNWWEVGYKIAILDDAGANIQPDEFDYLESTTNSIEFTMATTAISTTTYQLSAARWNFRYRMVASSENAVVRLEEVQDGHWTLFDLSTDAAHSDQWQFRTVAALGITLADLNAGNVSGAISATAAASGEYVTSFELDLVSLDVDLVAVVPASGGRVGNRARGRPSIFLFR